LHFDEVTTTDTNNNKTSTTSGPVREAEAATTQLQILAANTTATVKSRQNNVDESKRNGS